MGKKWRKKKKQLSEHFGKLKAERKNKSQKPKKERPAEPYKELVRESKEFEAYYKAQNFIKEEEWDTFLKVLKEDLPAAFRFTGSKNHAHMLCKLMQDKFLLPATQVNELGKSLTFMSLPWYPDKLGWQLNLTRKDIRRSEAYWRLHQFLITETETGNISRQEAVSMIPPLLLDLKAHHKVLDMCAAPGSKTAQIIELMHSEGGTSVPSGIVIANDADNKRCYMLTHQAKRLQSPMLLITNHDAAFMPNIHHTRRDHSVGPMKFDRILCDVPCSGDGTLRKNFDVWTKWNVVNGACLHGLQLRIARRGLELLSVGGLLVYSTCSLNPLEDEAVINRLLTEYGDSIALVDVTDKLPGLKFVPGLHNWTIMSRQLEVVSNPDSILPENSNYLHRHLFPPPPEVAAARKLDRCIRILPHHQDTGGFFVAVLEKVKALPGEKIHLDASPKGGTCSPLAGENGDGGLKDVPPQSEDSTQRTKPPPKKRRCRGYKEEPFFYLGPQSPLWGQIQGFYGFEEGVDPTLFLTRTEIGKGKNVYFTNALVKDVVKRNEERVKIINTGVKVLVRCDNKGSKCDFRLAQEGSAVLLPLFRDRKLSVTRADLIALLLNDDAEEPPQIAHTNQRTQELCQHMESGSVVFSYVEGNSSGDPRLEINLVGLKGKTSIRCYVAKNERVHFLRLLGYDTSSFEKNKFAELREAEANDEEMVGEGEASASKAEDVGPNTEEASASNAEDFGRKTEEASASKAEDGCKTEEASKLRDGASNAKDVERKTEEASELRDGASNAEDVGLKTDQASELDNGETMADSEPEDNGERSELKKTVDATVVKETIQDSKCKETCEDVEFMEINETTLKADAVSEVSETKDASKETTEHKNTS